MKHKIFSFIVLFSLSSLVILQSCNKPDDDTYVCTDSTKNYKLSAKDKARILYTGYDTICMVSNAGDTIHCIGTGRQFFTTRKFESYSNPACAGHGTEEFYEAYKIEFVDSLKNMEIVLAYYYYHVYDNITRYYDVVVFFKEGSWPIPDLQISNKSVENYFGDVVVQNVQYKKTNKVENYNSLNDTLSFMLINKTEGIIKLQLNATDSWELLSQ